MSIDLVNNLHSSKVAKFQIQPKDLDVFADRLLKSFY